MRVSSRPVEIGLLLVAVAVAAIVVVVAPRISSSSPAATRRTTAAAMAAAQDGRGPLLGGVQDAPAGRENDLHAIDLARFAVDEHNKKANAMLEFSRLVKVRQQVVAGFMYYFTVEVKDGGEKKLYEAKVWEKAWENFKELQDFKPVAAAASA